MRTMLLALAATALMGSTAFAQSSTTTTTTKMAGQPKTTVTTKGTPPKGARTEQSLACSASADSKNVHGKDRAKFMRACKKTGGKAG